MNSKLKKFKFFAMKTLLITSLSVIVILVLRYIALGEIDFSIAMAVLIPLGFLDCLIAIVIDSFEYGENSVFSFFFEDEAEIKETKKESSTYNFPNSARTLH